MIGHEICSFGQDLVVRNRVTRGPHHTCGRITRNLRLGALPPAEVEGVRSILLQGTLCFTFSKLHHKSSHYIRNLFSWHHVQVTPGAFWTHLGTLGRLYKTMGHQNTWFLKSSFSLISEDFDEIAADPCPLRSSWRALASRYGIYVGNHHNKNRECLFGYN